MRWTRRILILTSFGFLALALVWWQGREVRYGGRPLSDWVQRYRSLEVGSDEMREAEEAIQHIGTNNLPALLGAFAYDPGPRRKQASAFGKALPHFLRWRVVMSMVFLDPNETRANTATLALDILGPQAGSALPELSRLAADTNSAVISRRAMQVLTHVGNRGIAPLIAVLSNHQNPYRVYAADYLGDFGTNAAMAVPALVEALNDPSPVVRIRATNSLGKIAPSQWPAPTLFR